MLLISHWKKAATAAAFGIALFINAGAVHADAAKVYKATDTDTFWSLSKKFHVQLDVLMNANPNVDPLNIYAGVKITIPNGRNTEAKAAKAAPAAKASTLRAASVSDASDLNVINIDGRQLAYSDVVQAKASAYTAAPSENGWGPVDYFGNPLKLGTIAVDPKRIPLGSKVYVTGYDYDGLPTGGMLAVATDAGSAIKGDRIDIFVPDSQAEASQFGFQYVKVYVLN